MNNLQCVINVLSSHREARRWSDESVAIDILAQLGVDDAGEAAHAAPVVDPALITEEAVVAAEAAAEVAIDKAADARVALDAQNAEPAPEDHETVHGPDAPAHDEAARTADYKDQLDAALNPAP